MDYCRICHALIADLGCNCLAIKCPNCGEYLNQDDAEWFELGKTVECQECGAIFRKGISLYVSGEDE